MIEVKGLTKSFDGFTAVNNISFEIHDSSVYGLVGVNGAGKSTLLRCLSGIYQEDSGSVVLDGERVFDNPSVKAKIAFVPDELYLPPTSTMKAMAKRYQLLFPNFDMERFNYLSGEFGLKVTASFKSFSKGMKRQAATILALSCKPKYIFFDETFDGLDPFKRNYIKKIIADDVKSRGATAVITSHSLKELEDTCDQLALLDRGGLVFESETEKLKTQKFKIQVAFAEDYGREKFDAFDVISYSQHGLVSTLLIGGEREDVINRVKAMSPVLFEELPLTLEEVFTYELKLRGYDEEGRI